MANKFSNKFEVKDMKLVFSESLILSSNVDCTICHCNLNSNSIYNQEKGIGSEVSSGTCSHSFHSECINMWLKYNNDCAICRALWIKAT